MGEEREVVRSSLQKHCSGVKALQVDYGKDRVVLEAQDRLKKKLEAGEKPPQGVGDVVWTPAFCRMVALIGRCVQSGEPALLVGETGGGKTMACQLLSWLLVEEESVGAKASDAELPPTDGDLGLLGLLAPQARPGALVRRRSAGRHGTVSPSARSCCKGTWLWRPKVKQR